MLLTPVVAGFDEQPPARSNALAFNHPIAALFHILFKILAALTYLICSYISSSFVLAFVVVTILLGMSMVMLLVLMFLPAPP